MHLERCPRPPKCGEVCQKRRDPDASGDQYMFRRMTGQRKVVTRCTDFQRIAHVNLIVQELRPAFGARRIFFANGDLVEPRLARSSDQRIRVAPGVLSIGQGHTDMAATRPAWQTPALRILQCKALDIGCHQLGLSNSHYSLWSTCHIGSTPRSAITPI